MSVEDARKVTAAFQHNAFVAPPRTIEDITAVLDHQKRADVVAADELRARADARPPDTDDPQALRRFYFRRGLAARNLGRARTEIADLEKALSLVPASTDPYQSEVLWALRASEMRAGNWFKSLEYGRRAIEAIPRGREGDIVAYNALLATSLTGMGDLAAAEAAVATARTTYFQSLNWNDGRERLVRRQIHLYAGQQFLAAARGRYVEAERLARERLALQASIGGRVPPTDVDEVHSELADILTQQGRLLEAETEARAALLGALTRQGRYSAHTAYILRALVSVIWAQGRYREAEQLARARVDILEKIGTPPSSDQVVRARSQVAAALRRQDRDRESLAEYENARANVQDPAARQRLFGENLGYGHTLLKVGEFDAATKVLGATLKRVRARLGEGHRETGIIRSYLAQASAGKGDRAHALAEYRAVVPTLLTRSPDIDDANATRVGGDDRVVTILEAYVDLLAGIRGTPVEANAGIDATAEAFRLAEIIRGGAVARDLDASAARAVAATPALADLVRREQDVKRQTSALQGLLRNALSAPGDQQNPEVVLQLRAEFETLRQARQTLRQYIDREFPTYAELVNPTPPTIEQARAALRPGEALISIVTLPTRTLVWAIPHRGAPAFASVVLTAGAVKATVDRLRKALDPDVRLVGDIPAFDVRAAYELYRDLLEPVASGWKDARSLLVAPHGSLAQLPFALLVTTPTALGRERDALFSNYREVPWLVRGHAITTLPSVGALVTLRRLPPGTADRRPFIGFGDPYFSQEQARRAKRHEPRAAVDAPAEADAIMRRNLKVESANSVTLAMLPRLPDTADEIRAIADALKADPGRDVFLAAEANEKNVRTLDLARYRVVAFATHGLAAGELDGLTQPALALSAPDVANVEGDGLLTMEKILALRLNADWVVLSACNSAGGDGASTEAISGLGRAFFYAGARALLVSNWPVETTSARALTTDLFRRQAADPGLSRAHALQQTLNALIERGALADARSGRVVFSYAHPIFWAPFTLVGDGG
jgi:CHAT domain-containing protein